MKLSHIGMILLLGACSVDKGEVSPPVNPPTPEPSLPHNGVIKASQLTIHGQYVPKEGLVSKYGRLPKSLESSTDQDLKNIKDHGLHTDSAGLYIAFETDAKSIKFDFTLKGGNTSSEANDETESGFDLYSLENGKWESVQDFHLVNHTDPYEVNSTYNNVSGTTKKYILIFPLYNGVGDEEFTLTIPKEAKFYDRDFFGEDKRKPILIYGTSITQGTRPTRVGLAYTSRLLFDQEREIINMGFSANAWMCKDMTDYVTDIPSAVFFIDPTMNMEMVKDIPKSKRNAENMIRTYRKKHPRTPIVMVSQFDGRLTVAANGTEGTYGEAMKEVVEKLQKEGIKNLYFLSRDNFIPEPGIKGNGTKDYIHPGDEGMKGYANKHNEILKTIKPDESK